MKRNRTVSSALAVAMVFSGMAGAVIGQEPNADASKPAATSTTGAVLAAGDVKFIKEAAIGNMAEVQLGEMAREKASAPEVKEFAARMVTDHSKALANLKAVAQAKGVELPNELDAKHKETAEKLSKLSGAEFDKAYMKEMRKDHKKDVSEFEEAAKEVKDPELKGYVEKTLPVLKEHFAMAKDISKGMKGKTE